MDIKRSLAAILATAIISGGLVALGIYYIGYYGLAIFALIPFFMGFVSTVVYGFKRSISKSEANNIAFLTLAFFSVGLLVFAIEGLICIIMASPLLLLLVYLGSLAGYTLIKKAPKSAPPAALLLFLLIPITAFAEKDNEPSEHKVVTLVEIDADIATVWRNVVEFPELEKPDEFIFKTGIAYPINATIEGKGKGAIRYCNFTTGSFVEPITNWDEPNLLQFDVEQQPEPMREISFWDVDAPHLHDYFVSKRGQFKLTALPNGKTLLEGTTWYTHRIQPEFYWQLWSEYIVHKIHNRVLEHIKVTSEN